ncbi:hypothetical protein M408DRAFT_23022, partial [Serendipita vermifera MAFF 305830]
MDNNTSSREILLQADNYVEWFIKLSAAVMKKANINVMLGTVSMPQVEADLSNAQQVYGRRMLALLLARSISPEARVYVTNQHDGPLMWSQLKAV